jgi:hypothetical protein
VKRSIILALALISTTAFADCYTRSNIHLTRQAIDAGPVDIQKMTVPDSKGSKCVVRYRVHIGDDWHTAEGSGTGATEAEACTRAMDVGQGNVLAEIEPSMVRADMQMVCSDLTDIRVRPVRIGETIWESETDMHYHPQERKYFQYKRTKCRMFQERNPKDRNLITYQGIICQADSTQNPKWRVIDKY